MSFLVKKAKDKSDKPDLDRFRRKKRWWLFSIIGVILIVVLWYVINLILAYNNATTANTTGGSDVLQKAVKAENGPINILLMGIEGPNYPGGMLSDSIMIASVDAKTKTLSLLSVPRDLYVTIPGRGKDKVNAAHSIGESAAKAGEKGKGPALLKETLSQTFGIPIHYFVRLDFDGFKKTIDALGGVSVNVTKAIHDPLFPDGKGGYMTYSVKTGVQQMDGEAALKYARSRQTSSDFDRARRQQEIVSGIKDKLLSPQVLANPKKMNDLISILGTHVLTDFSFGDVDQAYALAKNFDQPTVRSQVLDNSDSLGLLTSSQSSGGSYIIIPRLGMDNYRAVQAFVRGYLATPVVKKESATIEIQSGGAKADSVKRMAQYLEWAGFTVTESEAPGAASTKTVLSDYAHGAKSDTNDFLKKTYELTAVEATKPEGATTDYLLVLGSDWTEIEKAFSSKKTESATPVPLSQLDTTTLP